VGFFEAFLIREGVLKGSRRVQKETEAWKGGLSDGTVFLNDLGTSPRSARI